MPAKLNTKIFIERAKAVHGDKYDYRDTVYKLSNIPVVIHCRKHGRFEQMAMGHMLGKGCQQCAKDTLSKCFSHTSDKFIKKSREVHGDTYTYDKVDYIRNSVPVVITCPTHGDFKQQPQHHTKGSGCPVCAKEARRRYADSVTNTESQFIERAKAVHGDKYDYSDLKWKSYSRKVSIICPKHGRFKQAPVNHVVAKQGCPQCGIESIPEKIRESEESFNTRLMAHTDGRLRLAAHSGYTNSNTTANFICRDHGEFTYKSPYRLFRSGDCPECMKEKGQQTSKLEQELHDFVLTLKDDFTHRAKPLCGSNKELDIYSPSMKLGLEVNGFYWHSDKFLDSTYHQDKTLLFARAGIRVIHIWEHQWYSDREKIEAFLRDVILGPVRVIRGRQCIVKVVSSKESNAFLDKYHLQGACSAGRRFGLYKDDELIGVATFGRHRFNKSTRESPWELIRLCFKGGVGVVGGSEKLMKAFERSLVPRDSTTLVSYASMDHSKLESNVYSRMGFKKEHLTKPGYVWVSCTGDSVLPRYKTQKKRLHKLFEDVDLGMTESEIMHKHRYHRVFNAGNILYSKTFHIE